MIDRTPLSRVAAFITVLYLKEMSFNFVVYIYK